MKQAPRNNALKGREHFRKAAFTGYLLLATAAALLAGCATAGKAKPAQALAAPAADPSLAATANALPAGPAAAAQPTLPLPTGPSVKHFTNGREGFVITEPGMDAKSRADFEQASAMLKAAQYDKAIELLEKVIAKSPGLTAPRINAAIAYRQLDKPDAAELHLQTALETVTGHPLASNEYGLLLRKAGRFAESRLIYEKALAAFPEYYPLHKNLGILCDLYLRDSLCAVKQYELYGKAMPKDPQVKLWIADLQTRLGRNMTASAVIENGIARP